MKKILKNWKHTPGIHCGSVAVRDVLNYYKIDMTEEMCFGLGSGLGFYYSIDSVSPSRSIHVRGPWMEANFFNHFGYTLKDWKYEDDNEEAHRILIENINNGIPSLIQTDIFFLDYYSSSTHFPGHIVVVCGYDDQKKVFYLSDTSFEDLKEVSFEQMMEARTSKVRPYPLSNNYIDIDLKNNSIDISEMSMKAIVLNAKYMTEGTETLRGKSGIDVLRSWALDIPGWKKLDDWKWASRFSYQVISRRGVDGAGFRWMYRDFLEEAGRYLPEVKKHLLPEMMDGIGSEWNMLSAVLKQASEADEPGDLFNGASQIINNILRMESEFYNTVIIHLDTK